MTRMLASTKNSLVCSANYCTIASCTSLFYMNMWPFRAGPKMYKLHSDEPGMYIECLSISHRIVFSWLWTWRGHMGGLLLSCWRMMQSVRLLEHSFLILLAAFEALDSNTVVCYHVITWFEVWKKGPWISNNTFNITLMADAVIMNFLFG
jgi:hypothetical protein